MGIMLLIRIEFALKICCEFLDFRLLSIDNAPYQFAESSVNHFFLASTLLSFVSFFIKVSHHLSNTPQTLDH